jgi:NAD(P)-dependent dehydrogenase (short-subunit alcohol dehydrogenase family)
MVRDGMTKAAMLGVANGFAKLTKGTGVTVNAVLGGPTYSHGVARAVDEIAAAQGYLASPLASATNGAAVRADGGVLTTLV